MKIIYFFLLNIINKPLSYYTEDNSLNFKEFFSNKIHNFLSITNNQNDFYYEFLSYNNNPAIIQDIFYHNIQNHMENFYTVEYHYKYIINYQDKVYIIQFFHDQLIITHGVMFISPNSPYMEDNSQESLDFLQNHLEKISLEKNSLPSIQKLLIHLIKLKKLNLYKKKWVYRYNHHDKILIENCFQELKEKMDNQNKFNKFFQHNKSIMGSIDGQEYFGYDKFFQGGVFIYKILWKDRVFTFNFHRNYWVLQWDNYENPSLPWNNNHNWLIPIKSLGINDSNCQIHYYEKEHEPLMENIFSILNNKINHQGSLILEIEPCLTIEWSKKSNNIQESLEYYSSYPQNSPTPIINYFKYTIKNQEYCYDLYWYHDKLIIEGKKHHNLMELEPLNDLLKDSSFPLLKKFIHYKFFPYHFLCQNIYYYGVEDKAVVKDLFYQFKNAHNLN